MGTTLDGILLPYLSRTYDLVSAIRIRHRTLDAEVDRTRSRLCSLFAWMLLFVQRFSSHGGQRHEDVYDGSRRSHPLRPI